MKANSIIIFLIILFSNDLIAQSLKEEYKAEVELQAIGTTNGVVPFWMRSNQYGSIPLSGLSGSVLGRLSKDYEELSPSDKIYGREKLIDWGFGFEARANGGRNSNIQLIEGYLKGKLSIFQLKAGRAKDVMGLNGDTLLSSGNFAVSGNALGIPKVELSIPNYWTLPIFNGLLAVKGTVAHGWVGETKILDSLDLSLGSAKNVKYTIDKTPTTYFHQKSFYGRLGREDWRLKLYGGFNHQSYWGHEEAAYGDSYQLTPFRSFFYVLTGRAYGNHDIPRSKIGNQIGSIDIGAEYRFDNFKVIVYRQNFYDVGALSKLANIADGLQGLGIENNQFEPIGTGFSWQKITLEYFSSKNQAGYPWSKKTASGDEDYYNNYYYRDGWSYKGKSLGNPLITEFNNAKSGQAFDPADFFINNRVLAVHAGLSGRYNDISFTGKVTYSFNYGTFGTSEYGKSTGGIFYPKPMNVFEKVTQFSGYLECYKAFQSQYKAGFTLGVDNGGLLDNSIGVQFKLARNFK